MDISKKLAQQKHEMAKRMKEREAFHKIEQKMNAQSKGLKRGMPAEYYKNISWNN